MTNRYYTPLIYKDGNGKDRNVKLYFELDPIELTDWTLENPFAANELRASVMELREIEEEDSRDLTQEEIRTMLGVIKLLSELSAGRPTDDGDYFLKDPNWTSSYAYRGFRLFLMTHPNEVTQFLKTLLDNDIMEKFTEALTEANAKLEAQDAPAGKSDSGDDVSAAMEAKIREKIAREQAAIAAPATPAAE
jgi:hypothetical protein